MSEGFLKKPVVPFAQVPNGLLNDGRISLKAKGLFAFMQGKPNGWEFSYRGMAKQMKEGKAAIGAAMKELKDAGWVSYSRSAVGGGVYEIFFEPCLQLDPNPENPNPENPNPENPNPENPNPDNRDVLNRKKEVKKKEVKKKGSKRAINSLDVSDLPISEELALELVDYRNRIKKSPLTQRALRALAERIDSISKSKGVSHDAVLTFMQEKGWASIEAGWNLSGIGSGSLNGKGSGTNVPSLEDLKGLGYA